MEHGITHACRKENDELFPTLACEQSRCRQDRLYGLRHHRKNLITDGVPKTIVQLFEVIYIQKENGVALLWLAWNLRIK